MKKLYLYFSAMLIGICMWMPMSAEATDVWVDHWNYENVDVYVTGSNSKMLSNPPFHVRPLFRKFSQRNVA